MCRAIELTFNAQTFNNYKHVIAAFTAVQLIWEINPVTVDSQRAQSKFWRRFWCRYFNAFSTLNKKTLKYWRRMSKFWRFFDDCQNILMFFNAFSTSKFWCRFDVQLTSKLPAGFTELPFLHSILSQSTVNHDNAKGYIILVLMSSIKHRQQQTQVYYFGTPRTTMLKWWI